MHRSRMTSLEWHLASNMIEMAIIGIYIGPTTLTTS